MVLIVTTKWIYHVTVCSLIDQAKGCFCQCKTQEMVINVFFIISLVAIAVFQGFIIQERMYKMYILLLQNNSAVSFLFRDSCT